MPQMKEMDTKRSFSLKDQTVFVSIWNTGTSAPCLHIQSTKQIIYIDNSCYYWFITVLYRVIHSCYHWLITVLYSDPFLLSLIYHRVIQGDPFLLSLIYHRFIQVIYSCYHWFISLLYRVIHSCYHWFITVLYRWSIPVITDLSLCYTEW
jgi:hypothetical protein